MTFEGGDMVNLVGAFLIGLTLTALGSLVAQAASKNPYLGMALGLVLAIGLALL